jgi:hypothetical protein
MKSRRTSREALLSQLLYILIMRMVPNASPKKSIAVMSGDGMETALQEAAGRRVLTRIIEREARGSLL